MKNEEFENIRARTICKEQSGQNSRKTTVPDSNFVVLKTENCKPKTVNQNHKTGPEGGSVVCSAFSVLGFTS